LGSWQVDVAYDATMLTITNCTATGGTSGCNPTFSASSLRVAGASGAGLTGAFNLATVTFKATGAAGSTSQLAVTVGAFTTPQGTPVAANVGNGVVAIVSRSPGLGSVAVSPANVAVAPGGSVTVGVVAA